MPKKLAEWSAADLALAAEQDGLEKVSIGLAMFYGDIVAGPRVLKMTPQQGKTNAAAEVVAWLAGRRAESRR